MGIVLMYVYPSTWFTHITFIVVYNASVCSIVGVFVYITMVSFIVNFFYG